MTGTRGRVGSGCGCIVIPLIGLGIAAYLLRNGIPETTGDTAPPELVIASVAVIVSLAFGLLLFIRGQLRSRESAAAAKLEPITGTERSRKGSRNTGRLFFGIFLLFGLGFMIPFGLMFWRLVESRGWEAVPCTIIASEVGTHSGDDGSTYSVDITYRYLYQGHEYTGDRYNFSFGSSSGYDAKSKIVARYPPGSEAVCWVDPDEPSRSALVRTVGWEALFILLPLIFVVIGLLGVLGTFGSIARKLEPSEHEDWLPGTDDEEISGKIVSTPGMSATAGDPNVLEASSSARGRLVGSIIGTVFWNGIVWTIVYFALIKGNGRSEGCLIAFLAVFALVGLGSCFQFRTTLSHLRIRV